MAASTNGAGSDAKLAQLREAMAAVEDGAGVAAYIVPTEDPHMASFAALHSSRRPLQRLHSSQQIKFLDSVPWQYLGPAGGLSTRFT